MPRFWRALRGPRVTVNPHVMSGPASSGQHVWIGRRARSTSLPSHTTCWHGAPEISFGAMCITCFPIGIQRSSTSRNPLGGSGSLRNASSFPISRSVSRGSAPGSAPMARATRRVVPNRLPSTGITWPLGFSNSKAGPPALSTRSQTSVISSFGSTSARTRFSSPARSSCDRKSRKSRYLISLDDRCCSGAVQRDSVPLHSPPNREVGRNSDKNDRADPVVLVKCLEAGFSVAAADEAIVMCHDYGRSGEPQIVDQTQPAVQADARKEREHHTVANHYRMHIVTSQGDRGCFDADAQIVVAIHHRVFGIVGDRPEDVGKEQPPALGRDGAEYCRVPHRDAEAERDSEIGLRDRKKSLGQGIGRCKAERGE